jgi:hypothetical protein
MSEGDKEKNATSDPEIIAEKKSNRAIKAIANATPEENPVKRIKAEEILILLSKGSESASKISSLI